MAETIQDFTKIYDSYLAAVKNGAYREVSAFLSKEMLQDIKTPEDREEFLLMAKYMAPASYETRSLALSDGGRKAEVEVLVTVKLPEEVRKAQNLPPVQRAEVLLRFVKEGNQWKIGPSLILGDPDQRARPKDLNMGSQSDYEYRPNLQMSGAILRVEKQAAGTVFLIRVVDEEIAAMVPAAKVSSEFVPGRILVLRGGEHKTDKLKFWASEASLHQE
jgi:hypothetical protein